MTDYQSHWCEKCFRMMSKCHPDDPQCGPVGADWQPIETAPKDETIIVFAPGEKDDFPSPLPDLVSLCRWHPDAGFCVCELREVTHWMPFKQPSSQKAQNERR